MLYLNRKVGETIIINGNIEVTIVEVRGKSVRIGCNFPQNTSILRKEVYDRITLQNLEASNSTFEDNMAVPLMEK